MEIFIGILLIIIVIALSIMSYILIEDDSPSWIFPSIGTMLFSIFTCAYWFGYGEDSVCNTQHKTKPIITENVLFQNGIAIDTLYTIKLK